MLKELNRLCLRACRETAAWRRWHRKLPHNRVRRRRIRDANGRTVDYGPPELVPEPKLSLPFCRTVTLPSGKPDVLLTDCGIAAAYRQARRPRAVESEVQALPMSDAAIRKLFEENCQ